MRVRRIVLCFTLAAFPLLLLCTACCPCRSTATLGALFSSSAGAYGNIRTAKSLASDRDQIDPAAPRARVLTYNVNFGGPRMAEAIEAIHAADADVVCLQETTPAWAAALTYILADQYPYRIFHDAGGAGGQGILSKKPIHELAWVPPTAGWFPAWIGLTDTPAGPLQLLAVHLKPPLSETGSVTWSAYFGAGQVQEAEVLGFLKHCQAGLPTVVLGDFNTDDCGDAIVALEQRGFADALPQFDRSSPTWHWETKWLNLTGRYDHILYSGDWACLSAAVITKGRSDHYPVVAELARIPEQAQLDVLHRGCVRSLP